MRQRLNDDTHRRRVILIAAGCLFLMSMVWQHVQATRLGYRVEKARQRILVMRCANGALRMQLETALSPASLSLQARSRLGMSLAAPQSLRSLDAPAAASRAGLLQRLLTKARRVLSSTAAA